MSSAPGLDRAAALLSPTRRTSLDDMPEFADARPRDLEPTRATTAAATNPDDDRHELPDLDDFLAGGDEPYDWVIPGIAEAGDRIVITGPEGGGKSTWIRQLCVQVTSGIHPFTGDPIDPLPVMLIDTENSVRQTRRKLVPLREAAGAQYEPGQLRLHILGHSLELARPQTYADIAAKVTRYQPKIIAIGPLYKLTDGDPIKEEAARALADALDHLRKISGAVLLIEAHTPYAEGAKAKRPRRPYGASLWSRWPEFGIYLDPEGSIEHWRGQRDERQWPTSLERSTPWPWAVRESVECEATPWDGPTECMAAIERYFDEHLAEEVSKSAMVVKLRALGLNYRDKTIYTALELLHQRGRIGHRKGPRNADLYYLEHQEDPCDF